MKRSRGLFADDDDEDDDGSGSDEEVANSLSQHSGAVAASQSNDDVNETVEDILALQDDPSQDAAPAAAPAARAADTVMSPSGSLADYTEAQNSAVFDQGFPMFLRRDVDLVPASLRNDGIIKFNIPLDIVEDTQGVIRVPDEHVRTMDGVAKCLQLIPRDDLSFYTQPADGFPMTFLARWAPLFNF